MKSLAEFDPNGPRDEPKDDWGSYCTGRNRDRGWKVHRTKAAAKAAAAMHTNIVVYEKVDNEWVERYRCEWVPPPVPRPTPHCDCCGAVSGWSEDRTKYISLWGMWNPRDEWTRLMVCSDCERTLKKGKECSH